MDLNWVPSRLKKKFLTEFYSGVDKRLSQVVLIEKKLMEEWQKQQD